MSASRYTAVNVSAQMKAPRSASERLEVNESSLGGVYTLLACTSARQHVSFSQETLASYYAPLCLSKGKGQEPSPA